MIDEQLLLQLQIQTLDVVKGQLERSLRRARGTDREPGLMEAMTDIKLSISVLYQSMEELDNG